MLNRKPASRCVAGLAAAGLVVLLLGAADPPPQIEESETTFLSHKKKVAVEQFAPKAEGTYPAIIILHGAGGISNHPRDWLRERARELARAGYVALIPHYFDRTGKNLKNPVRNREYYKVWMETTRDAVTYALKLPEVKGKRVGLLGVSLGAHVVLSEAMFDSRVSAVVEYAGGLFAELADQLERMPPTLILHGDADRIVPVLEARKLVELFDARQVTYEVSIYEGAGHSLTGADGKDAWSRTLAFFKNHVRGEP